MDIFTLLFQSLIPLYLIIALGWVAGRYFQIDVKTISTLAIYIFAPVSAFGFVAQIDFQPEYLTLPLFTWCIATAIAFTFLTLGKKIYGDNRANLLAIMASMGNTGFLGLPLALALLPENVIGLYVLLDIGAGIYLATTMYYIAARGQFSIRDSITKVLKFPMLYGIIAGLIINKFQTKLPEQFNTYHDYFVGAFILTGMMILGVSLSQIKKISISPQFISLSFIGKFILWPAIALAIIWIDKLYLHTFNHHVHQMMLIISIVPHGVTVAAFAAQMDLNPEKASTTILISTILSLIYVPLMLALSGLF